jgi:hypothetical protein
VKARTDIATAMCEATACVAVTEGKQVFGWGYDTVPTEVQALTDVATAMCGGYACVAVTEGKQYTLGAPPQLEAPHPPRCRPSPTSPAPCAAGGRVSR